MRYWFSTASGRLKGEAPANPRAVGHSDYGITPDVTLPAPLEACRWDGAQVVVDAGQLAELKAKLRVAVEAKAVTSVQDAPLTTPWGTFAINWNDLSALVLIGFAAFNAQQGSSSFSVSLRRTDDTLVSFTAANFLKFLSLVGERAAANFSARDTKLNALAAATAAQLKTFEP